MCQNSFSGKKTPPFQIRVVLNYETKSKPNERNETKRNILNCETKRNATQRNEIYYNAKRNEMNTTKQNEIY
jgi:hypothetical protein